MPPSADPSRRAVVTGLGAVTPIGNDHPTFWRNAVAGTSGGGPITHFDASDLDVVQLVSIPQLGEYVLGGDPMAPRLPRIAERLAAGDYAVRGPSAAEPCSRFLERLIAETFPADRVRRWDVPRHPELRVFRVSPMAAPALALDRDGADQVGR